MAATGAGPYVQAAVLAAVAGRRAGHAPAQAGGEHASLHCLLDELASQATLKWPGGCGHTLHGVCLDTLTAHHLLKQ